MLTSQRTQASIERQKSYVIELLERFGKDEPTTQMHLAKVLDVSEFIISKAKSGGQLKIGTVRKMADAGGIPRHEFLPPFGYSPDEEDQRYDYERYGYEGKPSNQTNMEKLHATHPLAIALQQSGMIPLETEPMFGKRVLLTRLPWPLVTEGARPMLEIKADFFYEVPDDALSPGIHTGELLHIRMTDNPVVGAITFASLKEGEGTRLICERLEQIREENGSSIYCFERTEAPADILGIVLRVFGEDESRRARIKDEE